MNGVYLFAAAVGVPLVLWFLVSGSDDGGEGFVDADGIGGLMLRLLPLSTLAITAAAFGVTGLLLGALGTGEATTLVAAGAIGVVAAVLNTVVFSYLRRSESGTEVSDEHLVGAIGRIVLPVAPDRRGRIALSIAGQELYLSACILPGATDGLEVGAPVLVVQLDGGVAYVSRLDPELT